MPHPRTTPAPDAVQPVHDLRAVLRITPFRRLWIALTFSSLGDWLGLLATAALAAALGGGGGGYAGASFAVAGVFIIRLAPAIVLGPIAGVVADRLDRRWTMVVCDVVRFALFVSIPVVGTLWWLYVASFVIECASMMWIPSKEATVPNLVPKERLESANQLSLFTTYGTAPLAAGIFTLLSLFSAALGAAIPFFSTNPVDLALYFNAATFLFAAVTIWRLREITRLRRVQRASGSPVPSVWRALVDGWAFVGRTPVVRGLIIGMIGAFAAGGAVVALAPLYVVDLGAGNAAYGVLFGTVFTGLAVGMFVGPRLLIGFSRRRLFGLAIGGAGLCLAVVALVQNLVIAVIVTFVLGAFAGIGWVTGYTLLGLEVTDDVRGRTFAFVQSLVRVVLVGVLAVAPLLAGALGLYSVQLTESVVVTYSGAAITMFVAGVLALVVGLMSYVQMDDRRGVPLLADLARSVGSGGERRGRETERGYFVSFEGGEGAGKTTQAERLATWLRDKGHEVVLTHQPGATRLGARLREMLLSPVTGQMSPRTEALLYAADRAEHVALVVRPALERGAIVITDRFTDSSVAYQGAGRDLPPAEIGRISRWATEGLAPDLTVVLDLSPQIGLARVPGAKDRLESEPTEFHERVRASFLALAQRHPGRYLVVDATRSTDEIAAELRQRLVTELPASERELAEQEEQRRQAEAETKRRAQVAARQSALAAERDRLAARRAAGEAARGRRYVEEQARLRAAEEERLRAEEEAQRLADEAENRRLAEEQRLRAEAEARRLAEEAARFRAEQEARRRAEEEARRREEEARRFAEEEARRLVEEEARRAEEARRVAEEARRVAEQQRRAQLEAEQRAEVQAQARAEERARRWRDELDELDDTRELSLTDELLGPLDAGRGSLGPRSEPRSQSRSQSRSESGSESGSESRSQSRSDPRSQSRSEPRLEPTRGRRRRAHPDSDGTHEMPRVDPDEETTRLPRIEP